MDIPKEKVLELLRERGRHGEAEQAGRELPDQVDPGQHAGLLEKFGLDPKDLLGKLPGGLGDKLKL